MVCLIAHVLTTSDLSCDSQEERTYRDRLGGTEGRGCKTQSRIRETTINSRTSLARIRFPKFRPLTFYKAPIEKLLTDNKFLKRDREKFQECIRSWEGRKKTLISHIVNLKADIVQQSERIIDPCAMQS